ncbi:MAG: substrate-binding domain-containing protein [Deltaproteobacteria bacterium]|nr:substrate-binding domain-containing protein [Deltaproteobacteria bacterium]
MKKWLLPVLLSFLILLPGLCWAQKGGFVFMASTIGPVDAGIVDALENAFEKETGIRVRHVGAGTGATLKVAEKGNIDLVMVHAKVLEEKFVAEGYGTERIDLMYNDFVIVGPASDPAKIRGMKTAAEALKALAAKQAPFVTRGDKSGTHVAEMILWEGAGIKPAGAWYVTYEKGSAGNAATLKYTNEKQAYTLIDRATYLSLKKDIKLDVLVEKDKAMLNYITLIPVNPKKFPRANYKDTMTFVKWLTHPDKGQKITSDFGKDKYGSSLFFPNSNAWRKKHGVKG